MSGVHSDPANQISSGSGSATGVSFISPLEKVFVGWWGAKGDASTNDTAAIMAAAESLRVDAASCQGTLAFPRGDYRTTGLNFGSHYGLRLIGTGSKGINASSSREGSTIIRASGVQAYVIRNASADIVYRDITFHGNDQTTQAVALLEYFTYSANFYDCSFVHTKFDNTTPANGASLIEIGGATNLQVDSVLFQNCFIRQNPENGDDVCYKAIKINQNNAYRNHFVKCSISGAYYNVYITAGGAEFFKCDFEGSSTNSNAHIVRDYSYTLGGLVQMSPTWVVDCFTETAKPWVKDINATDVSINTALDQSFGELFLIDNFTSTQPNIDICLLANTHISGGTYNNINIQANLANGGAGNAFVISHGVVFYGGADFIGSGASTNLIEVGTVLTPFPYTGTKSARNTFRGTTDFSGGLNTSDNLIFNVPSGKAYLFDINGVLKLELTSAFLVSPVELFMEGNRIIWEATTSIPLITQDTSLSDIPTHDLS